MYSTFEITFATGAGATGGATDSGVLSATGAATVGSTTGSDATSSIGERAGTSVTIKRGGCLGGTFFGAGGGGAGSGNGVAGVISFDEHRCKLRRRGCAPMRSAAAH